MREPENLRTITVSGGSEGSETHFVSDLEPDTEYSVFIIPHSRQALTRPSSLKIFRTKEDGKIFY